MRPTEKLTFEAVVSRLRSQFLKLERQEAKAKGMTYPLGDVLMSGFAMLFFQDPSMLQFQERMLRQKGRANLQTMFGVREVPKETQMRERLDEVECARVRLVTAATV